jgi:hypothetical protein
MEKVLGLTSQMTQNKVYADVNTPRDTEDFMKRLGTVHKGDVVSYEYYSPTSNHWFLRTMSVCAPSG